MRTVTSIPFASTTERTAAGSGASVTTWSSDSGPHTRTIPVIENFATSAISTTWSAPAIISRLIGTSTIVVSHTPELAVHAARAQERDVGLELAQRVLRQHAHQRAVVAAHDPAGEHELDARVGQQLLDHREVRRDDRDLLAVQVARHLQRRRADVDHHRLAVLDERRGGGPEAVLDVEALHLDLREARLARGVHGAAVDALELAVARQRVQIAADGHLRHAEALRQVGDVRLAAADGAKDLSAALCRQERHDTGTHSSCTAEERIRTAAATCGQLWSGSPIPEPVGGAEAGGVAERAVPARRERDRDLRRVAPGAHALELAGAADRGALGAAAAEVEERGRAQAHLLGHRVALVEPHHAGRDGPEGELEARQRVGLQRARTAAFCVGATTRSRWLRSSSVSNRNSPSAFVVVRSMTR